MAATPRIAPRLVAAGLLTVVCVASCFLIGRGCKNVMTRVDKLATSSESDLLAAAGLSELKAEVKYADGSFTVINRDSSDWLDVVFEVNGRLLGDGYIFQAEKVAAGATNVIAATRFVNEEGKHFDPAARKPQIFAISATCDGETRVIVVTLE